jgi:hypothetical protein
MGFWDSVKKYGSYIPSVAAGKSIYDSYEGSKEQDAANKARQDAAFGNLNNQGGMSSVFADQGQQGYGAMTQESQQARDYLRKLASGQESLSAEQLRQGNQQAMSAQRSMAASASPQNSAMAARTAAQNMGRINMGLAGQQATAGIQERQAAQQALANMIMQQRGQDLPAALGSRQNAIGAFNNVANNPGTNTDDTRLDQKVGATTGLFSSVAQLFSDRRLKTDVRDGDGAARRALDGLRAYTFNYKNQEHGAGKQVGVMAQDLEKAGLGHTVMNTPEGKAVHGGKLAAANTALLSSLARRVGKLESK